MWPEADKSVYVQAFGPDAFLLLGTGCSDLEPGMRPVGWTQKRPLGHRTDDPVTFTGRRWVSYLIADLFV